MWLPPFSRTSLLSLSVFFIDCSVNIGLNLPLSVKTYRSSSSLAVSPSLALAGLGHCRLLELGILTEAVGTHFQGSITGKYGWVLWDEWLLEDLGGKERVDVH
ncbi:hypothetical protein DV515_00006652 [Chloebia gouldiae]|uniref:Uncharacterized protein n=1 Tax=Chloebia gouldiae TaxID=44316 RepID=A0A3L8SLF1_CHLGU|nr:hypothetical protein DV515_00006652 [Chloebia gouldiae]